MKKLAFLFFCITYFTAQLSAQGFSYGFKAGLNFSKFSGPSERDEAVNLETFNFNTGFHVGASFIYKFTDLYGAKAELLFSQKGGKIDYSGSGFQKFPAVDGDYILVTGNRMASLNVSTSYIDVPIMVYGRVLPWLEVSGGVNVAVLINSTATGEVNFVGESRDIDAIFNLDYNYSQDELIDLDTYNADDYDIRPVIGTGTSVIIPKISAGASAGAYYDFDRKLGKLYRPFDFGLNAGVSFFINSSLYVGYRLNYGLSDVTNNSADVSRYETGDRDSFILRTDKDTNLSMQASIGFSF